MDFLTRKLAGYVLCADGTTLDSGTGGDVIATDDISGGVASGHKVPRNKIGYGADGSYTEVAGATTGLPVQVSDGSSLISPATAGKQDTGNTSLASIDGKITAVNTGAVVVSSSALPSGASTAAKQPALGTAGTASADVITVQGVASMTPLQVADNGSTLSIDDGGGNISIDDGGNTITVDGTVTANLAAGTNNIGDVDVLSIAAGDNNIGNVDIVTMPAVTNAGTFAVQESGGALTALQIMDDWDNGASDGASVSGDVAHDAADAGEPVKIGAKAIAYGSNPTAVAAADRTDLYANRHGVLMVLGGVPGVITKEWTFTDADGAQTDAALVTVSAGTKIAVTNVAAICDNANTGDVAVRVGFAASTLSAAATSGIAGIVMSHPGIAAGSGYNRGDGSGVLGVGADGEDLRITCEDPAGGSIRIIASYFEIAS